MLMRRWTPPLQIPTTSLDYNPMPERQRPCLRWCKVIISTFIPIVLLSFCIVYTLQKDSFFNKDYEHQQRDQYNRQQQLLFNTYIEDISKIVLQISDRNHIDENLLLHIRTKTLMLLRSLETKRKEEIILFLYERQLLQDGQINLRGADLNHMQLTCPTDFHHLYLPGVLWSNAVFINCRLKFARFDQTNLVNARFINCTLQNASLIEVNLDNSQFIQTIILTTDFSSASLIQANFLQAEIVQGNNFTNSDLYQSQFTSDQWAGKKVSILEHDFSHARLPNGSFGLLNLEENLVKNGDAEIECLANKQTIWTIVSGNHTLLTDTIENTTMNNNHWGNCSFLVSSPIRVYQNIDLHSYTRLIDTNDAEYTFLAYATCDQSYFEIDMYRSDNILHQSKRYSDHINEIKLQNNNSMYLYGEYEHHVPIHTRNLTISFGIQSLNVDDRHCYFDNITLTINQCKIN